jgi:hydroxymethylpyrimidine/phosphomethylpyrimidine kinase
LTIAGSDPSGGAGIQSDLKTIAAHGFHGTSCITVLTVQNTKGLSVPSYFLEPALVRQQIRTIVDDFRIGGVKVGLLGNIAISRSVAESLENLTGVPVVLDPVIMTGTGNLLIEGEATEVLRPVLELADVVSPNIHEAEAISGMEIASSGDVEGAARAIMEMGPRSVVVTGGHMREEPYTDVIVTPEYSIKVEGTKVVGPTHGSGCTFSTSLACNLAMGKNLEESVRSAKIFTESAIARGRDIGAGNGPVDPLGSIVTGSMALNAIEEMANAVARLESTAKFSDLIPQVGTNIAMAPEGARNISDVVGLTGRIVRVGGVPRASGFPMRGGSSHMARMALTLRKKTGSLGCCMNIRFDRAILDICGILGFTILEFDRGDEPGGEKTMSWGLVSALGSSSKDTPDIVYDEGSMGKEPMIRVLGSNPMDVVDKVIRIASALK